MTRPFPSRARGIMQLHAETILSKSNCADHVCLEMKWRWTCAGIQRCVSLRSKSVAGALEFFFFWEGVESSASCLHV